MPGARTGIDGVDREPQHSKWGIPANPAREPRKQLDAGASTVFAVKHRLVKPIRRGVNIR